MRSRDSNYMCIWLFWTTFFGIDCIYIYYYSIQCVPWLAAYFIPHRCLYQRTCGDMKSKENIQKYFIKVIF